MSYPRGSFFDLVFNRATGWFPAVILGVGLVVAGFAVSYSLRAMRLETRGATVTGTVIDAKHTTRRCGKHNTSTCHTYTVSYAFRLPDGRGNRLSEKVSKAFFQKVRPGGDVLVHYLPDDLTVAEIDWGASRRQSWWLDLAAVALMLLGGLVIAGRVRRVRQIIWLSENGTPATVTVDRHEKGPFFESGKRTRCAYWYDATGPGRTSARRPENLPQPGTTIRVLADPRRKFPSVWEEDLL